MGRVETVGAEGFRGRVHGVSLVDLLQMFHLSRRTIALRLTEGSIHLRDGEVIHAQAGELSGEAAFEVLIGLTSGELDVEELTTTPVTVERSFETILMDALVRIDERNAKLSAESIPCPLVSADSGVRSQSRSQDFDSMCQLFVDGILDAVCCAVVALDEEALVVGMATVADLDVELELCLAQAAAALFRSSAVVDLESALTEARDAPEQAPHLCDEVHLMRGPYLYLGRTLGNKDAGLLVVTQRSCPIGLALAQLNSVLLRLGTNMPFSSR